MRKVYFSLILITFVSSGICQVPFQGLLLQNQKDKVLFEMKLLIKSGDILSIAMSTDSVKSMVDRQKLSYKSELHGLLDTRLLFSGEKMLGSYKNAAGLSGLYISNFICKTALNKSHNLKPKEQYSEVFDKFIVPLLQDVATVVTKSGSKRFFVSFYVLQKDFADDGSGYEPSCFAIEADLATLNSFLNSQITDDQFGKKISVYNLSAENSVFKKISL